MTYLQLSVLRSPQLPTLLYHHGFIDQTVGAPPASTDAAITSAKVAAYIAALHTTSQLPLSVAHSRQVESLRHHQAA